MIKLYKFKYPRGTKYLMVNWETRGWKYVLSGNNQFKSNLLNESCLPNESYLCYEKNEIFIKDLPEEAIKELTNLEYIQLKANENEQMVGCSIKNY